jgi:hypothetical protein
VLLSASATAHALRAAAWLTTARGGDAAVPGRDLAKELELPVPGVLQRVRPIASTSPGGFPVYCVAEATWP